MGSGSSRTSGSPPDTPVCRDMSKKYGPKSVECVNDWVKYHGFPEGGSLSVVQIESLRQSLQNERKKEKEGKSKCTKDKLERMHVRCWGRWKEEAELRQRKAMAREMGVNRDLSGKVAGRTDNASREKDKKSPPPYSTGDTSPTSPYAHETCLRQSCHLMDAVSLNISLTLWALVVDFVLLLNTCFATKCCTSG
ncbi:hypothetical protein ATANTOWER_001122 [Ataeniobius toweri]|uniref:Uncharacterized protein n=1 Tax=Ataeniobius toweri TaxID=208326 RepID=A0ABU7BWJ1_9TELE|nr:hypothetical protein [Ataeniobius toweri]